MHRLEVYIYTYIRDGAWVSNIRRWSKENTEVIYVVQYQSAISIQVTRQISLWGIFTNQGSGRKLVNDFYCV